VATAYEKLDMTEPHLFKDPTVTREPTHTEFGIETYHCACGETKDINIAKTEEHEWTSSRVKREPTETEEGVIVYYCDCGERRSEAIPKLSPATTVVATTMATETTASENDSGCRSSVAPAALCFAFAACGVSVVGAKRKK
jgi:hypothetical protein